MMYKIPDEPAMIRQSIRRYERALEKELAEHGSYRDGAGKRYLLAPLYLIMGDLEGALRSFAWYDSTTHGGLKGRHHEGGGSSLSGRKGQRVAQATK